MRPFDVSLSVYAQETPWCPVGYNMITDATECEAAIEHHLALAGVPASGGSRLLNGFSFEAGWDSESYAAYGCSVYADSSGSFGGGELAMPAECTSTVELDATLTGLEYGAGMQVRAVGLAHLLSAISQVDSAVLIGASVLHSRYALVTGTFTLSAAVDASTMQAFTGRAVAALAGVDESEVTALAGEFNGLSYSYSAKLSPRMGLEQTIANLRARPTAMPKAVWDAQLASAGVHVTGHQGGVSAPKSRHSSKVHIKRRLAEYPVTGRQVTLSGGTVDCAGSSACWMLRREVA